MRTPLFPWERVWRRTFFFWFASTVAGPELVADTFCGSSESQTSQEAIHCTLITVDQTSSELNHQVKMKMS